ncbi:MAG: NAD(P)/FAD-dependent oxidoreductase [Methanomicrobiales archaeon]|nr:NAD(P)/FAD-dependent oxidoreductase [Methanomicrobiales archaeon]
MYDVVVVGAGPSGSTAARECAKRGLTTLCIEEHGTIGHPVQCAGLLSLAAWQECGVSQKSVLHEIRGARFVTSAGDVHTLDAGVPKACVVDRGILDREIAASALAAGADLRLKTYVQRISPSGGLITTGVHGREEVQTRLIIAADGVRSGIARLQGFPRSPVLLTGLQAEIRWEMDPGYVEVHPHASPDFFGWVIPAGKNRARVGLCGTKEVQNRFDRFLCRYPTPCTHHVTGAIPLGVMPRTYGKRTLYVGDAAGLVKPTSGGGVYTGVRSARHAADVAAICCERDRFDDGALSLYEQRWKKDFGRELRLGFRLFQLRGSLTPEEVDRLLSVLDDPSLLDSIKTYGDMDRPRRLFLQLAKKPAFYPLLRLLVQKGLHQILR